jgi:hypothetical protein
MQPFKIKGATILSSFLVQRHQARSRIAFVNHFRLADRGNVIVTRVALAPTEALKLSF